MKLLVDMILSPRWVGRLAEAGIEAAHWSAVGLAKASDPEIMRYASTHGYVVLTHHLDFSAILAASGGDKPSVVQIRAENVSVAAIGARVVAALRQEGEHAVRFDVAGEVIEIGPGPEAVRRVVGPDLFAPGRDDEGFARKEPRD